MFFLRAHPKFAAAILFLMVITNSCTQAIAPTPLPPSSDTPPPCTTIGQQFVSPIDGVTVVCVPAGEFMMGADESDPDARPHEKPQHRVFLDAFWMDRTEATNANFQKCVDAGVCKPRSARRGTTGVASLKHLNYYYDAEFASYPVLIYEVEDAKTYCKWAGRRLPTEAEWEKAARGSATDSTRTFPWGNEKDCKYATFFGCTVDTVDVESYANVTSSYGALNMAGNVWEWVADQYAPDYYANSPENNPQGPAQGEGNVRRGGGWRSLTRDLRFTVRASGTGHHYFDGQMGFRCAMSDRIP